MYTVPIRPLMMETSAITKINVNSLGGKVNLKDFFLSLTRKMHGRQKKGKCIINGTK